MTMTVTLTLDDEAGAHLKRVAADQGRTPADIAAWIVTEDLRRERAIDAELLARIDDAVIGAGERPPESRSSLVGVARRERAGARLPRLSDVGVHADYVPHQPERPRP